MHRRSLGIGHWALVIGLLLLFWGRVLINIRDQSPVVDESVHMTRAVAYWRTGDLRLQRGHTPLTHALSGTFLALEPDLPSPAELKGWNRASLTDVTRDLLWEPGRPVDRAFFLGRWPILGLGLILSALAGRWASELFGRRGGIAALFLCTFDPNILAHSSLVTTDLPVTCLIFVACYTFSRWLDRPTLGRLLMAGAALGLAWGTKLSALVLLPVLGSVLLWRAWRQKLDLWSLAIRFLALLSVSTLTLWAIYRFEASVWPQTGTWVPMPTHWDNLQRLWKHQARGHHAFFLGQFSYQGWWYYFPVLLLIKTPLPLLILVIVSIASVERAPKPAWSALRLCSGQALRLRSGQALMVAFPVFYLAASIASSINIGYRHVLPLVPFAVLGAAAAFRPFDYAQGRPFDYAQGRFLPGAPTSEGDAGRPRWRTLALAVLTCWMALASLWIHPYTLAYFNELVGGPDQGYRYVVDSNLDWGQDLKRLKAYLDEQGIERIRLSYFGTARPELYGIDYDPLPMPLRSSAPDFRPFNPAPGTYAISASNLQGVPFEDPDTFDWFRRRQPVAKVGYSIFIYEVEQQRPGEWAAICYAPIPALEAEQIRGALGDPELRLAYFDCRSGWVYPAGQGPGWYVIPAHSEGLTLTGGFLRDDQIVFEGRPVKSRPALRVYRWDAAAELAQHIDHLRKGESEGVPFGDVAVLLGSEVDQPLVQPGEVVTVNTYWRVMHVPDVPLSIMAHLTDEGGRFVTGADGLGMPVENWRPGDILVQAHKFAIPLDVPPGLYVPRIGLYALGSLERIPLADGSGDSLALEPLRVGAP